MLRIIRVAVALAALAAFGARAHAQQDPEPELDDRAAAERAEDTEPVDGPAPIRLHWEPKIEARVRAGAGAVSGDTINPGRSAMSLVEGTATGRLTRGQLALEAPLELGHRQTFGGPSLTESHVRGAARGTWRFTPRVRVTGELALSGSWKPDWPDPFQPLDTGGIGDTDRYSHWDRRAGLETVIRPFRRQRIRIAYDYTLAVYKHDPMFDAIYDPIHLTPWDRDTHRLDAVWRLRRDRYKLRVGAELARRKYFFVFAGDADTGVTHAGPGGEPPNPLLELRTAKPRVELEYEVHPSVVVVGLYELELQQDAFHGYLSFVGHHPEVLVSWALPRDAELTARAELFVRRYGSHSYDYDMDPAHPPLAWGDRRAERLGNFALQLRLPIAPHWSAVADLRLAVRRTNYTYSIDWNYVNWVGWAGAEYRY